MYAAVSQKVDLPLSDEERLSHLVDDLISLNAEGGATRSRLLQQGWTNTFLDNNLDRATQLANERFVRQVDEDPVPSLATVETEMTEVISRMMPSLQLVTAELQARNFSTRHIDLLLTKARARAALGFALGSSGLVN